MDDKILEYLTDQQGSTESGSGAGDVPFGTHVFPQSSSFNVTPVYTTPTPTGSSSWLSLTIIDFTLCQGQWLPPNHILFQVANAFLFLAFVAPPGLHGMLYMRICLLFGCSFFAFWGWIFLCAFDTFLWNAVFTIVNLVQIFLILYMLRPIHLKKDINLAYQELFKPLRVSKYQFKKMLNCMKEVQILKSREAYCLEKVTRADKLTLVLSGRLVVTQGGHTLHVIERFQFLDSPEWFGVSSDEYYQTTIIALEESRVLVWNRDKLRLSISGNRFLQSILDNILGKDVVKKLLLVTESSCNGANPSHNSITLGEGEITSETAKLLQDSKVLVLGQQIENSNSNVWNLANITEDTETTV